MKEFAILINTKLDGPGSDSEMDALGDLANVDITNEVRVRVIYNANATSLYACMHIAA